MFTTEGGVEIEQVASENPTRSCASTSTPRRVRQRARPAAGGRRRADVDDRRELYRCFTECDATLCEINPLIVDADRHRPRPRREGGRSEAPALFRHPTLAEWRDTKRGRTPRASRVRRASPTSSWTARSASSATAPGSRWRPWTWSSVAGGRPANFCDLGGGGSAEGVVDAARSDRPRSAGAVDPLQHLRRDHARRRGGAGHPRGARPRRPGGADRRAARRHQCRGGSRDPPRGGSARSRGGADDVGRRPARGGAGLRERRLERARRALPAEPRPP